MSRNFYISEATRIASHITTSADSSKLHPASDFINHLATVIV